MPTTALRVLSFVFACLCLSGCFAPSGPSPAHEATLQARLLVDLVPSAGEGSYPRDFVTFNGTVYFSARDPEDTDKFRLFYLSGSSAVRVDGTHPVSSPITLYNGALYFLSFEPGIGQELFRCTAENTIELAVEVRPGSDTGATLLEGDRLVVCGDKLCFVGVVDSAGQDHRELFVFDSADSSAVQASVFGMGSAEVNRLSVWGSQVYFFATPSDTLHDFAVYRWEDGVGVSAVSWASGNNNFGTQGTVPVVLGSKLWFLAEGPSTGSNALGALAGEVDLYSLAADGTFTRESDFSASSPMGSPFSIVGGNAYFVADPNGSGDGPEWYRLTPQGLLTNLGNLNPSADRGSGDYTNSFAAPLAAGFDGNVIFGAGEAYDASRNSDDTELYRWSGSGLPQKIAEIGVDETSPADFEGESWDDEVLELFPASPQAFATIGNRVYFSADDRLHGAEVWVLEKR